jgi:hypothetical protein
VEEIHTFADSGAFSDIYFEGIAFTPNPKCGSCWVQPGVHDGCNPECELKEQCKKLPAGFQDRGEALEGSGTLKTPPIATSSHSRSASSELEARMLIDRLNKKRGEKMGAEDDPQTGTYSIDQVKELIEAELVKERAVTSEKHQAEIKKLTETHSDETKDLKKKLAEIESAKWEAELREVLGDRFSEDFFKEIKDLDPKDALLKVAEHMKKAPETDPAQGAGQHAGGQGESDEAFEKKMTDSWMGLGANQWSKLGGDS